MEASEPFIHVVLRLIGQAAVVDHLEISHGPNVNRHASEAWRLTALLLMDAIQIALDEYERIQKENPCD